MFVEFFHTLFALFFLDIVEGNLKSIMRLILALAAHFKPNSVKQSAAVEGKREVTVSRQSSVAGLAHVSIS